MIVLQNAKIRASNSFSILSFRNHDFSDSGFLMNYNGEPTKITRPRTHPKTVQGDQWSISRWYYRLYSLLAPAETCLNPEFYWNRCRFDKFTTLILTVLSSVCTPNVRFCLGSNILECGPRGQAGLGDPSAVDRMQKLTEIRDPPFLRNVQNSRMSSQSKYFSMHFFILCRVGDRGQNT